MPPTIINTDYTGFGPVYSFTGDNDSIEIATGTTVVSTNPAIFWGTGSSNLATIYGEVTSGGIMSVQGDGSSLTVASGAQLDLSVADGSTAGLVIQDRSFLYNHGTITSLNTFALSLQGTARMQNTGTISGVGGVVLGNFSSGSVASNTGSITATGGQGDPLFSAAVVMVNSDTVFFNMAGGTVRAQNNNGAGVTFFFSGGGLVQNHGTIISDAFYGVDLSSVTGDQMLNRLVNRGEITGGNGVSYNGSVNADHILNRGDLNGDVVMGNGNDTIDNRAGTINGDWFGGEGDDYYLGHLDTNVTGAIYGGNGNDTLLGGDNSDRLYGDNGNDFIQGMAGDDFIYGGAGNDTLAGQGGDDQVYGGAGNDLISGGEGNDILYGGEGKDTLFGGTGDDVLYGGGGGDILFGGAGADTFVFTDAAESPVDVGGRAWIMDFKTGEDRIDLSQIDADTVADGHQSFTFIGGAAFSGTAGELRYDRATWLVTGDTDGDGIADLSIVLAHGPTGVTAADFILV